MKNKPAPKKVADFFDKYAFDFNSIYGTGSNPLMNFLNKKLRKSMEIRFIKTIDGCDLIEGCRIIDIGCGAGHYTIALAKKGAAYLYGIDFAKNMIDLARNNAEKAGVGDKCKFDLSDFLAEPIQDEFDYSIIMGFMDYSKNPRAVIEKVLNITKSKAFFSFPASGGILALQRKLRYLNRCNLFFYDRNKILEIFKGLNYKKLTIEKAHRDYFVTVEMKNG